MKKTISSCVLNLSTGKTEAAEMIVKSDGVCVFSIGEVRVGPKKQQIYPFTPGKRDVPENHKSAPGSIYYKNFCTGHIYEIPRIPTDTS